MIFRQPLSLKAVSLLLITALNSFLQPQGPPQQGQQRVIRVLHQPRARMHYVDSGRQMVPQGAQSQQPGQRVMILRPANNHPGQQPQHRIQGQVGPRIVGPGHPQPRYQQMQVVRPMHPGQQQRPIRVMQHHQPQVQPPQRPRPQYQQYHPRPPGPPQPGQPQGQPITVQGQPGAPGGPPGGPPSGDVILNVEHHFIDNGKLVKKVGCSGPKAGLLYPNCPKDSIGSTF